MKREKKRKASPVIVCFKERHRHSSSRGMGKDHATLVSEATRYGNSRTQLGLSFEMATLIYFLNETRTDPEMAIYDHCRLLYVTDAGARECEALGTVTLLPGGIEVGLSIMRGATVDLFEDEDSLEAKVSALSGSFALRSDMAWLAMNVDHGDYTARCYDDPFQQLQWLQKHIKAL
ncbi:hypothetical protein HPB51_028838 [Rhipicephalus microplus]|uniref:Uncharacterized protein n=1 Tax=Rhipicephalus microplus TaxID=6941 RepID=A0A9J6CWR1_RHIMP|nr:hypothetical protein HPB51_028838 [Rhipicephalus microplus]